MRSGRYRAMPSDSESLGPIWSQYSDCYHPTKVEYLANHGGFSGARLWRVASPVGPLCLRAWPPESPNESQLAFIHKVLLRVQSHGVDFVPAPRPACNGSTIVRHEGLLWELTPWMPGRADYQDRSRADRLRAAMRALACFHLAAASTNAVDPVGTSSTLERRVRELRSFLNGPASVELWRRVPDRRWPEMDERALQIRDHMTKQRKTLAQLLDQPLTPVTQQPVIRDIWHDHILYTGNEVTGIIDFGAMSVDTVAVDIARLLGSLAGSDELQWREGLRAYRELRPVSMAQQELLLTLDRTGVFAGALVWLRWHYLDHRSFENQAGVLARVDHFLGRLGSLDRLGPAERRHPSSVA